MKIYETRQGDKITTYTVDLDPVKKLAKSIASNTESFLKKSFRKEEFVKKDEKGD